MAQDEFAKLFKYMEKHFDSVDKRFEETHTKIDKVLNTVDGIAKAMTDYHQEMLMLAQKVDRMEQWIHEIAEKTGTKLSYM